MSELENPTILEEGWKPSIDEIHGFLQNVIAMSETLPEEAKIMLDSLAKEWNDYKDLERVGYPGKEEILSEAREKIINLSLKLSNKIPKVRINL